MSLPLGPYNVNAFFSGVEKFVPLRPLCYPENTSWLAGERKSLRRKEGSFTSPFLRVNKIEKVTLFVDHGKVVLCRVKVKLH